MMAKTTLQSLPLSTTLLTLAACGGPSARSPGATPERTLPPTVTVEVGGTVVWGPAMLESPEQAQELVSFPVLVADPETLPTGLRLEGVAWKPYPEKGTEIVSLSYRRAGSFTELSIQQIALGDKGMRAPRQPHEEVSVRGTTGHLFSTENGQAHSVTWQESGTMVGVSTGGMVREETLRIVEGMRPVGD
jgi:hypothetical protein